ncbi:bifunctional DNA-formamidopyrimidine glycosylase/DNA-(apurinic or apyrimidinic site) lyase [Candidatus Aerophobetes bacterium]|nr:bifunctional DNA-formamidopyrimidine glycosylase/DNA-(apurinic or apyrimidinic site) lyase [Candidatus Aerophobetes bacterium]
MPELPEVETIKQGMVKKIKGKKIGKVDIRNEKNIKIPSPQEFKKQVEGKSIQDIERKGKYLLLSLNSHKLLIFHLKLTGRLLFFPPQTQEPDYVRIVFNFFDTSKLFFCDIRGFAEAYLLSPDELDKIAAIKNMGPDPLCPDFTLAKFKQRLKGRKGKIKPVLMDQKVLAGIGNIYSQEAVHKAGIHPERDTSRLTSHEIEAIYRALLEVLKEAIEYKGSSVDAYLDLNGEKGDYVPRLKVYGREGENCYRCKSIIKRKKISGRGTYFCDNCQK